VLTWGGKAGLIGAVTPSIDRHHAVMGALGERFLLYRIHVDDPKAQARRALANRGQGETMRRQLADAAAAVIATVDAGATPRPLTPSEVDQLVDLATFVVTARTAVERDGYDREVAVMPSAEAPGRIIGALSALLAGCEAVGADQDTAWRIVTKAAWGCVPVMRTTLLHRLHTAGEQRTSELVSATGIPKTTTDRQLDDLLLLGLVDRHKHGAHETAPNVFALSELGKALWPGACPEVFMSPMRGATEPLLHPSP
jgi:hypothetical protein